MISKETIEAVKERVNLVDLVSRHVQLKRAGSGLIGLCPFHAEKSPSFHVRDERGYRCFGCGASGNAISFIMQLQGLSFPDAVEQLAQQWGIPVVKSGGKVVGGEKLDNRRRLLKLNLLAQEFFQSEIINAPAQIKRYIQDRGISDRAFTAFGLGFAPAEWGALAAEFVSRKVPEDLQVLSGLVRRGKEGNFYDIFRGRITFPVYTDSSRIAGFGGRIIPGFKAPGSGDDDGPKYLNSPETPLYEKHKILFGLPQALPSSRLSKEIFIVEGYLDVMGMWQAGVEDVVATCGTALTEQHARRLKSLVQRVYLMFDGDAAGTKAAARSFPLFLNTGLDVRCLFLPAGEDPDTFAKTHGSATKEQLLKLPQTSAFEGFLKGLIREIDSENTSARNLSPAGKGIVGEKIKEILTKVQNSIERSELLEVAAQNLGIPSSMLQGQVQSFVPPVRQEAPVKILMPFNELPRADQDILSVVMVKRQEVITEVLTDPILCSGLAPATVHFIGRLGDALKNADNDEAKARANIKVLMQEFGPSWTAAWRRAHEMGSDKEVRIEKVVNEVRNSLRIQELKREVQKLQDEMRNMTDIDKATQAQTLLAVQRQLKAIANILQ